jgi:hypothetical protein
MRLQEDNRVMQEQRGTIRRNRRLSANCSSRFSHCNVPTRSFKAGRGPPMFKILFRVALAYAAYRISREFVHNVPDIESGPDPAGMYRPPNRRQAKPKRSAAAPAKG